MAVLRPATAITMLSQRSFGMSGLRNASTIRSFTYDELTQAFPRASRWYLSAMASFGRRIMMLSDTVFLVLLVFVGVTPLLSSGPREAFTEERSCYIFNHLAKAGGTTVSYILKKWAKTNEVYELRYDTDEWKKGTKYAKKVAHRMGDFSLIYGGYSEALRAHVGDGCKWFTLFRHPVPRLLSAYFFCKVSQTDQCCATMAVDTRKVDLNTFAKHWSDYALRQFALTFVLPESVLESKKAQKCKK